MRRKWDESSDDASRRAPGTEFSTSCAQCHALHRPECPIAFGPICERCAADDRTVEFGTQRFHALSERAVTGAVGETSAGTYTLGYLDGDAFAVFYVGRSDSDVSASLHAWVDAPSCPPRRRASPRSPWSARSAAPSGLGMRALGGTSVGIDTAYTHFAFCYAPTAIAAFERECRDFHDLGGIESLDNQRHPEAPAGSPWACPIHG